MSTDSKMTKFYFIGKFEHAEEIAQKIKCITSQGYELTHNWTMADKMDDSLAKQVEDDLDGVCNADFVVALIDHPSHEYRGSFAEIGCAIGLKKRIYLITNNQELPTSAAQHCFLFHRCLNKFNTWEEFLKYCETHRL